MAHEQKLPPANELELLIRARYPLISIISVEERRVLERLRLMSRNLRKKLYVWSAAAGLKADTAVVPTHFQKSVKLPEIVQSMEKIVQNNEAALYFFKDLDYYLDEPIIIRVLKELSFVLRHSYKNLIFIAPEYRHRPEIESCIALYDFPHPSREELKQMYNDLVADYGGKKFAICHDKSFEDKLTDAALGLTEDEFENVISRVLVQYQSINSEHLAEIYSEKKQIIRKSGVLDYYESQIDLNAVGGLRALKIWLRKRKKAFSRQAREFGLPLPKGILLLGVQGCGKSLSAKAVANYFEFPLLKLDMGRLFSSFIGSSEENVRKAIHLARTLAPVVLWIDELDKALSGLKSSGMSDAGTTARVAATLLTWLQEKEEAVFVVATANDIESLPPELFRRGRFDEIFFVDLPDEEERREIFSIHLQKHRRAPENFDIQKFVETSEGFSGAEIEQSLINALFEAFDKGQELHEQHVLHALRHCFPLSKMMEMKVQTLREWAKNRALSASGNYYKEKE